MGDGSRPIHQLVARAFLGPRPRRYHTNHIDGVKVHNWASNLEYLSPLQNYQHAAAIGNGHFKLMPQDILSIRQQYAGGMKIAHIAKRFRGECSALQQHCPSEGLACCIVAPPSGGHLGNEKGAAPQPPSLVSEWLKLYALCRPRNERVHTVCLADLIDNGMERSLGVSIVVAICWRGRVRLPMLLAQNPN